MTGELHDQPASTSRFGALRDRVSNLTSRFREPPEYESPATGKYRVPNALACGYLDANDGVKFSSATITTYEQHLTEFVAFLDGRDTRVLTANREDIRDYIEHCVTKGNRQSTLTNKLTPIKELYKYIHLRTDASQHLSLDPLRLDTIDLSEYNTPSAITREALSRQELRQLFDAMQSYRNRLMAIVAAETGLRNSDLRNLRADDVDSDRLVLYVRDPKGGTPYNVPFSRQLNTELSIWEDQFRTAYTTSAESEFLFPSWHGERLTTNTGLNRIIKDAAERAGIQETIGTSTIPPSQQEALNTDAKEREWNRVTVHTLRHTCLTLMQQDGVKLSHRQLVGNHQSDSTTRQYSHGDQEAFKDIRNQFNPPR